VRQVRTKLAAGEAGAEAVDVEGGPKDCVNLLLEDASGLVAAEVGACDAVVAAEAVVAEGGLHAHEEVVSREGLGEVGCHVLEALCEVPRVALGAVVGGGGLWRLDGLEADLSELSVCLSACMVQLGYLAKVATYAPGLHHGVRVAKPPAPDARDLP
jgi:hypothetical protein